MRCKLSPADRKAIDLLLDGGESFDPIISQAFIAHSDVNLNPHVEAAERVFDLLGLLPVVEPSVDLACRTLGRIRDAAGTAIESNPLADAMANQRRH